MAGQTADCTRQVPVSQSLGFSQKYSFHLEEELSAGNVRLVLIGVKLPVI